MHQTQSLRDENYYLRTFKIVLLHPLENFVSIIIYGSTEYTITNSKLQHIKLPLDLKHQNKYGFHIYQLLIELYI